MIIPARWYSGGKGLDDFRSQMLNDPRIRHLVDYTDSTELFPGVDIAGGICYFLWDRDNPGICHFTNNYNGKSVSIDKALNEYSTFIRYPLADGIISGVLEKKEITMDSMVTARKPFGLATNVLPMSSGDLVLRYNKGTGPYDSSAVSVGRQYIDKWKVMISYLSSEHAGQPDKSGQFRVLSTMELLPPKTICTETYLLAGSFDNEEQAKNLLVYLKTKFVRFLVIQIAVSQHITKNSFSFVPVQDFTKSWTDEELYKKYGLSEEEIAFIESMIKPME
jgi:site-specific DNA-methyltransferase (adenine-specific)